MTDIAGQGCYPDVVIHVSCNIRLPPFGQLVEVYLWAELFVGKAASLSNNLAKNPTANWRQLAVSGAAAANLTRWEGGGRCT